MNTLQAKNTSLSVRIVGLLALVFIIGTQAATAQQPAKVLLLLHGMNSSPDTWNHFVDLKFNNSCATIVNGVLTENSTPNQQGVLCYRIGFGSFDPSSGRVGLEDITATSPLSGDFSNFMELGWEVRRAVRGILNNHNNNAEIVLVAHSRGGLAARAFLQEQAGFRAKASVVGLLTTGASHRGSQLGRIYKYLEAHPRGTCCQADWEVVDFLRGTRKCSVRVGPIRIGIENPTPLDVRRPTIRNLADDSFAIDNLNQGISQLPATIPYGQIVYEGLDLGILKTDIPIFDEYSVFGDGICDQVSSEAEGFMLGDNIPGQYSGDGVLPVANQRYFNLPGFSGDLTRLHRLRVDSGIIHTQETEQEAHISAVLAAMMGSWWTG